MKNFEGGIILGFLLGVIIVFGSHFLLECQQHREGVNLGREEILTGKVVCVLDKMEEDKPKFICKTKEQFLKDIEFMLKSGMVKKKEGSSL